MTGLAARHRGLASQEAGPLSRSGAAPLLLAACAALLFAVFAALGTWQLYRLQWKLALIERVEQRVHAAPSPAPPPARWQQVSAASDEYRHVRVTGALLHGLSARVQASTGLGSGYWLLTPLRSADGSVVLVNRGFIPVERNGSVRSIPRGEQVQPRDAAASGPVTITGLLRIGEPGGAFLRDNDPAADRWYSRDVRAIAAARGLANVAPYFVDADRDSAADPAAADAAATAEHPVGGMTVIAFHNNHLVYALTWYALALMVAGAVWVVRKQPGARRRTIEPRADCMDRETDDARRERYPGE